MIDLSTMVGKVISPTNRRVAGARDVVIRAASLVPTLKRYILEMRFKPMPLYEQGAVVHNQPPSPGVGTLFIQPRVDTREQQNVLLDDVIGPVVRGAVLEQQPAKDSGREGLRGLEGAGRGLRRAATADPAVLDRPGRSRRRSWSATAPVRSSRGSTPTTESVMFLRPDRCIAGACIAQRTPELSAALFDKLTLIPGGNDGPGPLLHVAQPAAEPAGPVSGTARRRRGRTEHRT